jgi:type IV pilus assembly protein PilV
VNQCRTSVEGGVRRDIGGFTLMEVLITIVILSIGLLGVAGLQLNSLRSNQNALDASVAANLAMEGADRIRANLPGIRNPDTGLADRTYYDFITAAGTDPNCMISGCTVAKVAQTDAYEWISKIQQLLPGGVGVICRDSTPNDGAGGSTAVAWDPQCDKDPNTEIFAIKIAWDHDGDPSTPFQVYRMSLIP